MNQKDFENLSHGDVVRHKLGHQGFMVGGNYLRGGVIIVRTQLIHNAEEWDLIEKAGRIEAPSDRHWGPKGRRK